MGNTLRISMSLADGVSGAIETADHRYIPLTTDEIDELLAMDWREDNVAGGLNEIVEAALTDTGKGGVMVTHYPHDPRRPHPGRKIKPRPAVKRNRSPQKV